MSEMARYGGINSLIYGIVNRALMPFGLHHIVNTTLWFSSVGGQFDTGAIIYINGVSTGIP
jgi:phosphotransferase system  glucose/maltose/N-acetylglucosamine-specific IIC component